MSKRHSVRRAPRWGLWLGLIGALVAAIAAVAFWQNNGPKAAIEVFGAPSLKPNSEKIDLGDVPLGQTVEVQFELANVGDKQLRFTSVPYVEVREGC